MHTVERRISELLEEQRRISELLAVLDQDRFPERALNLKQIHEDIQKTITELKAQLPGLNA